MDLNLIANMVLLFCAGILGVALAYRYYITRQVGARAEAVAATPAKAAVAQPAPVPPAPAPSPDDDTILKHPEPWEKGRMSTREIDRLLDRVIEEDDLLVQSVSKELLQYLRGRGKFGKIRPQALEAMATEFAILAAAFKRVSMTSTGEPCTVTDEVRSALLKEAFRLVASQVGYE